MKPICVKCQRFYRAKKNGYRFIEGMPVGNDRPEPGTAQPDRWTPYKLWVGDLWQCQGCGHELVSGFAPVPIAEHYEPEFSVAVDRAKQIMGGALLQVNDC